MMGPYYYYDIPQTEVHDCMWSGECYHCRTASLTGYPSVHPDCSINMKLKIQQLPENPVNRQEEQQIAFLQDGHIYHDFESSTKKELADATPVCTLADQKQANEQQETQFEQSLQETSTGSRQGGPAKNIALPVVSPNLPYSVYSPPPASINGMSIPVKYQVSGPPPSSSTRSGSLRKSSSKASRSQHQHHNHHHTQQAHSTSDNKKLRHREVEKNRHRQLQAMVKTLSDQIPGKLDKETQVQTMKRAARYCIFLKKAATLLMPLSEAELKAADLQERLEKVYLRSCGRVELIMSQSSEK